jgi:trigger factor
MTHQLTRKANHTVEIVASVDAAAVANERDRLLKLFARRAHVPGFRPGKAPIQAVRSRFAAEVEGELKDELTGRLWREVLAAEQELRPLTEPSFTHMHLDAEGFTFTAEMEVSPHFDLPSLDGVAVPAFSLEVAQAEVDGELEQLRDAHATWEPAAADAVAADGLVAEVELVPEEGNDADEARTAHFLIGGPGVPSEFSEVLRGAKVGDRRQAVRSHRHGDGDDAHEHQVTTSLTVKGLKCKVLPPSDDDLAKTIGLDSLAELVERVREHLGRQKRNQRRETWRRHLLDHLEQGLDPAEMPASLVGSTVREDLSRFAYSLAMQGVDLDKAPIDWAQLAASGEAAARAKVLDNLVLAQLADDWQMAVPEATVEALIRAEASRRGIPATEHKANLAKQDALDDLRHAARIAATVDELIRRAGGEVD